MVSNLCVQIKNKGHLFDIIPSNIEATVLVAKGKTEQVCTVNSSISKAFMMSYGLLSRW
jgi:hypothetical protein